MQWLMAHFALVLAIAYGIVSEGLSIIQLLKFPENSGVGGILSAIMKMLLSLGATPPAPPAPQA